MSDIVNIYNRHVYQHNGIKCENRQYIRNSRNLKITDISWSHLVHHRNQYCIYPYLFENRSIGPYWEKSFLPMNAPERTSQGWKDFKFSIRGPTPQTCFPFVDRVASGRASLLISFQPSLNRLCYNWTCVLLIVDSSKTHLFSFFYTNSLIHFFES